MYSVAKNVVCRQTSLVFLFLVCNNFERFAVSETRLGYQGRAGDCFRNKARVSGSGRRLFPRRFGNVHTSSIVRGTLVQLLERGYTR